VEERAAVLDVSDISVMMTKEDVSETGEEGILSDMTFKERAVSDRWT
jgi:hypothetical protein